VLHTMEMDCRADALAARHAREFVAGVIKACGLIDLVERGELLTSEVVTNAIVHADSPVHVVVEAQASSVVVEVKVVSSPPRVVVDREEVAEADRGPGMVLVDALSDRWGWWATDGGSVVWFALLGGSAKDQGMPSEH
jgi:anti-sigma regulatory factor (Ser/Thr protein kinase)